MKCLPFALTLFAVLAAVSPCRADGELRALQDNNVLLWKYLVYVWWQLLIYQQILSNL